MQETMKNSNLVRSPTLETVFMVERTIEKYSGEFNRTGIWKRLPRKVMWQTYIMILEYLQSINKIAIDSVGKIGYIWSPEAARIFGDRPRIKLSKKLLGGLLVFWMFKILTHQTGILT